MINGNYSLSTLFSGLNKNSFNSGIYSSISDYSSIKSGAYSRLLKKYYSADDKTRKSLSNVTGNISTGKADSEKIVSVRKSAEALKSAASSLMDKSVFDTKDGKYDRDKIYQGVSDFVNSYNRLISETKDSGISSVDSSVKRMTGNTVANSRMLSSIGIKTGTDNRLTIDKDMFMNADMDKVKSLFNSTGGYGYQAGSSASMIDYAAQNEASKSNTYTSRGGYSYNYNSGNLFNYGL